MKKFVLFVLMVFPFLVNAENDDLTVKVASISSDDSCIKLAASCHNKMSQESFIAYALSKSPLIAEIDSNYAAGLAEAFNVGVLKNPELEIEQSYTKMYLDGSNDPQFAASIGQAIRLSDFGTRSRISNLIKQTTKKDKKIALLELIQKLKMYFYTIYMYQETDKILMSSEIEATKILSKIEEGVKQGVFSLGDQKLFIGEKNILLSEKQGNQSVLLALQNDIQKSTLLPCHIIVDKIIEIGELPSLSELVKKSKSNGLSASARTSLLAKLASEQSRLARLDAFPEITPKVIYQHSNDGGDFVGFGVSIPLAIWDRNQGEREYARSKEVLAELEQRANSDEQLESQIYNLRLIAVNTKSQVDLYNKKIIPAFKEVYDFEQKKYLNGKGSSIQVWQTQRTFNEVRIKALQLYLESLSARLQLSLLIGEEL